MSDLWAKLEGHAVNGVFPLRRYLGGSNHSVVFLTESARLGRPELALKLVPAVPALAQLQLARWRASAALLHPHLVQIFEAGQCQIGERPFLYVVTDYADQNLAQLLERRALTEEETREMLGPVLESLAFLHGKNLVQGRLKPSNVLVVGDQIKLASDTIRPFSETGRAANVASAYMPPEARDGVRNGASDIWALGVTLSEALARQQPTGLLAGDMLLPPAVSSTFRGVIARCLHRRAKDRPTVTELQVWARGAQLVASLSTSGSHKAIPEAALREEVIADPAPKSPKQPKAPATGGALPASPPKLSMGLVFVVILAAFALFVMVWAAVRSPAAREAPAMPDAVVERLTPAAAALVQTAGESTPSHANSLTVDPAPGQAKLRPVSPAPSQAKLRPVDPVPASEFSGSSDVVPSLATNEVIPDVPQRARKSIRGRVRVSVRLIVDQQGKVFAALVDNPGPSRYFERLALEAAEQWTFPPSTSAGERLMLVRFDFSRTGTTARADAVN